MVWPQNGNKLGVFKGRSPVARGFRRKPIQSKGEMMVVWSRMVVSELERNEVWEYVKKAESTDWR